MIELNVHKQLRSPSGEMELETQLNISKGEFVSIYGKSGAGKTSLLKILVGLLKPDQGSVVVNNEVWVNTNSKTYLSPQKRNIGFVFQDYALFPNMTVKGNLLYALGAKKDKTIINELIEVIELGELQDKRPQTLSGGQQQRVALARALVQQPQILLLDEPLSAVDNEIRLKLQEYLKRIHHEYGLTTLMVSHDISEVVKLSDNVILLEDGKIKNQGTPEVVFGVQNNSNSISLSGEVITVDSQNNTFSILIGDEIIQLPLNNQAIESGDHIKLNSSQFDIEK